MKRISELKVDVNFKCLGCKQTAQCSVSEAIYNGAPYCQDCQDDMEIVDCEIDSND